MKYFIFSALLFVVYTSNAQQLFKADTTGEMLHRYQNIIKQNSLLAEARFSHNTSRGKIYTLPVDNMPCLVPDMKQVEVMRWHKMPEGRMPNVLPKQSILPGDQKEKK